MSDCDIPTRNGLNSASIRHEVNDELISSIEYNYIYYPFTTGLTRPQPSTEHLEEQSFSGCGHHNQVALHGDSA